MYQLVTPERGQWYMLRVSHLPFSNSLTTILYFIQLDSNRLHYDSNLKNLKQPNKSKTYILLTIFFCDLIMHEWKWNDNNQVTINLFNGNCFFLRFLIKLEKKKRSILKYFCSRTNTLITEVVYFVEQIFQQASGDIGHRVQFIVSQILIEISKI